MRNTFQRRAISNSGVQTFIPTDYFYFNLLISRKRNESEFYLSSCKKYEDEAYIMLKPPKSSGEEGDIV